MMVLQLLIRLLNHSSVPIRLRLSNFLGFSDHGGQNADILLGIANKFVAQQIGGGGSLLWILD